MSDKQIEHAELIRGDESLPIQWHGLDPREAACRAEEGEPEEDGRAAAQELVLVYCFAEARPEDWRAVAARAHALLRTLWPWMVARRSHHELLEVRGHEGVGLRFPMEEVAGRLRADGMVESMGVVMGYYYPDGREWLRDGTRNLYLVARMYQPGLVTQWGADLTYERLAGVFGELPARPAGAAAGWRPEGWDEEDWARAVQRAKSRWSARAQGLITRKMEEIGARRPAMFGKGAAAAESYRRAARGNTNRRRGKK